MIKGKRKKSAKRAARLYETNLLTRRDKTELDIEAAKARVDANEK